MRKLVYKDEKLSQDRYFGPQNFSMVMNIAFLLVPELMAKFLLASKESKPAPISIQLCKLWTGKYLLDHKAHLKKIAKYNPLQKICQTFNSCFVLSKANKPSWGKMDRWFVWWLLSFSFYYFYLQPLNQSGVVEISGCAVCSHRLLVILHVQLVDVRSAWIWLFQGISWTWVFSFQGTVIIYPWKWC